MGHDGGVGMGGRAQNSIAWDITWDFWIFFGIFEKITIGMMIFDGKFDAFVEI